MADVVSWDDPSAGIQKKVLYAGKEDIPHFSDGTKVAFFYQTRKCDDDHTVLDDNKAAGGKPMELYIGKKFKFEVWEKCIKTMRLNEVASFTVDPSLLGTYPMVAKSLRDIHHGKAKKQSHHCCGLTMHEHGLGYSDLDDLMKHPEKLEFILELVKVDEPGDYQKDAWAMDENEKLIAVPRLKEEGNDLYRSGKFEDATDKYSLAIGMLDQLILREKPGDEAWNKLNDMKMPLLLNYSQCKLSLKDYYQVIEHTSEVLKHDPDNVKALYRRAKAHLGAWNPDEAKKDFERVSQLDQTLQKAVRKELKTLEDMEKAKDEEDRAKLQGKLFT